MAKKSRFIFQQFAFLSTSPHGFPHMYKNTLVFLIEA